jgi:hypothetical protein
MGPGDRLAIPLIGAVFTALRHSDIEKGFTWLIADHGLHQRVLRRVKTVFTEVLLQPLEVQRFPSTATRWHF